MTQTSTPNKRLLRYIYQELSPEESVAMASKIVANEAIKSAYENIVNDISLLPRIAYTPSSLSLHRILHHASVSNLESLQLK